MNLVINKYTDSYLLLGDYMLKSYLKSYLILFGLILVLTIILSLINYFFLLPLNIFKIIIPILSIFISSIILGRNVVKKAYLEGIKFSSLFLIIVTIIKLILKDPFNYKVIIMYLSIILTSIIGLIIGINTKKK